jgi:hypothetical protein
VTDVEDRKVLGLEVATRKTLFVFPLAFLLTFLGMPGAVSAKSRTVKIVISGGGLTSAIEVTDLTKAIEGTDSRILDISNIWTGDLLDSSRGTLKEPPRGLPRYEVSRYIQTADSDAKKKYVWYDHPNVANPSRLYLPTG